MLSVNLGMVKGSAVLIELLKQLATKIHCDKALKQLRGKKSGLLCAYCVYKELLCLYVSSKDYLSSRLYWSKACSCLRG